MEDIITIDNLCKSFKDVKAVDNLSFRVKRGELFAFLGVNGAGKSTTISIMCGNIPKDSGSVKIKGLDVENNLAKISKIIGVVFQNSVLDNPLTVKDNLLSRASLYGITGKQAEERILKLASMLEFEPLLNRVYGKLSGGQKRKIDVARALIHNPEILILDEPTTGLDPHTRRKVWNVINALRRDENLTVLLTTHYMEEATDADYVIIIDSGKISAEGTPLELKNKYSNDYIYLYNVKEIDVKKLSLPYEKIRDGYKIEIKDVSVAKDLILKHQQIFKDFEIVKGKMDDVFLAVTGKTLVGGN